MKTNFLPGKALQIITILLMLPILAFGQKTISARVVDDKTNEVLPYVNIYIGKERGTITNDEGDFAIECMPEDTIRLSYVGYEKMFFTTDKLPQTIRMRPLYTQMAEVMVEPVEATLMKVIHRLNKEYKKKKRVTGEYFYRLTNYARENPELIEAVLEARSAVNLRDIMVLNGRHFSTSKQEEANAILKFTNLYHILEIGPAFNNSPFWVGTLTPLNRKEHLDKYGYIYKGDYDFAKYYDISRETLFADSGTQIYKIGMRDKGLWKQDYILCGTLYIDAQTYQLLRFEGELKNFHINIHNDYSQELVPASLTIDMGYDHTEGFTQVKYISTILKSGDEQCRSLLFKRGVEDKKWENKVKSTENVLSDILLAGYDSTYWEKTLIQRTSNEEIIVMKAHPELYRTAYSPLLVQKASQSRTFGKKNPQEFVYVHMDNNCYFPGDTLYYKIYTTNSANGKASEISQVAYAELFNHDGFLVERQTIHLEKGQGHGAFCLDSLLVSGFYELRVYTRWQLNWGVYNHPHTSYAGKWFLQPQMEDDFFKDYEKLYSRVFPIYDKPENHEDFPDKMTFRTEEQRKLIEDEDTIISISFYPEGGAWIQGVWQRMAFEAGYENGRQVSGELSVYDESDRLVTKASTTHRGKGLFEIKGEKGQKYTAVFTPENGQAQTIDLPKMEKRGVAMQVDRINDLVRIRIEHQGMDNMPLGFCIMHNGIQKFFQQIDLPEILVPTDSLPAGVTQFTVFDEKGRVWADRLAFFHNERVNGANLRIEGIPAETKPFAPIDITIKGTADSRISISVKDKVREGQTHDNGNLMSELLLCSQIRGFVEDPMYYFEEDTPVRQQHLDLLLMTQGWRRFKWEEMAAGKELTHPAEKKHAIEGEVYAYSPLDQEDAFFSVPCQDLSQLKAENNGGGGGPILTERIEALSPESHSFMANEDGYVIYKIFTSNKDDLMQNQRINQLDGNVLVHAEAVQPGNEGFVGNIHTNKSFTFSMPHTSGKYHLFLSAAKVKSEKDYTDWIVQNPNLYPNYHIRLKSFYPRFVKPYSYYQSHLPINSHKPVKRENKDERVKAVAERPAIVMDAYTAFNHTIDAGLTTAWYAGSLTYSINVTRLLLQDMGLTHSYELERRWNGRGISENISPKEQFKYNHLEYLDKISIFTDYSPRLKGVKHHIKSNKNKVVFNIKPMSDNQKRTAYRDRYLQMNGYNVCKEFYSPDYSKQTPPDSVKDYRRTLYWNPNLMLDKNGKASITLYNNSRTTQISVDAQGQAADGTLLWGK